MVQRTGHTAIAAPPSIKYSTFREFIPTMGDDMLWVIYSLASTLLTTEKAIRYYARRHNIILST